MLQNGLKSFILQHPLKYLHIISVLQNISLQQYLFTYHRHRICPDTKVYFTTIIAAYLIAFSLK